MGCKQVCMCATEHVQRLLCTRSPAVSLPTRPSPPYTHHSAVIVTPASQLHKVFAGAGRMLLVQLLPQKGYEPGRGRESGGSGQAAAEAAAVVLLPLRTACIASQWLSINGLQWTAAADRTALRGASTPAHLHLERAHRGLYLHPWRIHCCYWSRKCVIREGRQTDAALQNWRW